MMLLPIALRSVSHGMGPVCAQSRGLSPAGLWLVAAPRVGCAPRLEVSGVEEHECEQL